MTIPAVVAFIALMLPVAYVVFRKFSATRQEIEFGTPQDGVAAIHLDIHDDVVRSLRIYYADGTCSELRRLDSGYHGSRPPDRRGGATDGRRHAQEELV
jgi:hypothetical protein